MDTSTPRGLRATTIRGLWWTIGALMVLGWMAAVVSVLEVGPRWAVAIFDEFDPDRERGVGAWFSSILLFVAALRCWEAWRRSAGRRRVEARGWLSLAVVLTAFSLDESAAYHERLGGFVARFVPLKGVFTFGWVVVGIPFVVLFGVWMVPFLFGLPRETAWRMVVGGLAYVGGALGFEMVGAALSDAGLHQTIAFASVVTAEETLEMAGTLLFIAAVWAYNERRSATRDGGGFPGPDIPDGLPLSSTGPSGATAGGTDL